MWGVSFSAFAINMIGARRKNVAIARAVGSSAAERQARRELLKHHGLAQMCHLFLPAAIQPGMSPWVHQERQRPNTNY